MSSPQKRPWFMTRHWYAQCYSQQAFQDYLSKESDSWSCLYRSHSLQVRGLLAIGLRRQRVRNSRFKASLSRAQHLDIALVKLNPSVKFNNSIYFESKVPKRLLRSHEIPNGVFFPMDGMSTGVVFLMAEGIALHCPKRPAGAGVIAGALLRD